MKNEQKERLLSLLQKEISLPSVQEKYKLSRKDFTRKRILSFSTLVIMRLNLMNKSISVELSKFFSRFCKQPATKQAFSKAIRKIKWEGFEYFNSFFIKGFYESSGYQKFKNKYLVVATDGTTYQLPYNRELVEYFGEFDHGQMRHPICMARSVKLFDVLNKKTICTTLSPYNHDKEKDKSSSEQALFEQLLAPLKTLMEPDKHNILLVGDKYYPSFYYFKSLPDQGFNFVFRCKTTFCAELIAFAQSGQPESILAIDLNKSNRKHSSSARRLDKKINQVKVRCVRIDLASPASSAGNEKSMFLLTNLRAEECTREELGLVYDMRWGEETSFDVDKNLLEMENFSSKTVNGVLQEFHAKTLTANIASLLIQQAQEELDIEQENKNNKYQYKINQAVAIGLIKDEIVSFLDGSEPVNKWMERITKMILPHRVPIRPGRTYPKKRKHKLKFSMNMRRVT